VKNAACLAACINFSILKR